MYVWEHAWVASLLRMQQRNVLFILLLLGVAQHHDFMRLDALSKFKASGMLHEQVNVFHSDHDSASAHDVIDTGDGS